MTKLFALFPPRADVEVSLEAYVEESRDIPPHWLRHACRRICDEPGRVFLPSISELRSAAALEIRDHRRRERGIPEHTVWSEVAFDPIKQLAWARNECPGPILQGGDQVEQLEAGQ